MREKLKTSNSCIKVIDFGIAFKVNEQIYVHKNLKNYPKLYKAIIKHEEEHSNGFNFKDVLLDLKGKHLKNVKKQYYKFLFKEKKAWYMFLPIVKVEGKWVIDIFMSLMWTLLIIMFGIIFKLNI